MDFAAVALRIRDRGDCLRDGVPHLFDEKPLEQPVVPLIGQLPHCEQLRTIWFRVADEEQSTRSPARKCLLSKRLLCVNKRHFIPLLEGIPSLLFPYKP